MFLIFENTAFKHTPGIRLFGEFNDYETILYTRFQTLILVIFYFGMTKGPERQSQNRL